MFEVAPSPLNARQHIEAELLEEVCRARRAWREAPDGEQEPARRHFREALGTLASVVFDDRVAGGG